MSFLIALVYVASGAGFLSAVYRLVSKISGHGLWWDDCVYVAAEGLNLVLLGINIYAHLHFPQQELSAALYVLGINAYFIATWATRIGVVVSLIRASITVGDRLTHKTISSFFLLILGLLFCITGTVIYIHGEGGHQRLTVTFKLLAICSDVFADTYLAFLVYDFFKGITLAPRLKFFTLMGMFGPISTMFIAAASWVLSLTIFSSNSKAQMCMMNITASYSVAMCSMPNLTRYLYKYFKDSARARDLELDPEVAPTMVFRHHFTTMATDLQDVQSNDVSSKTTETKTVQSLVHACSSLTIIELKDLTAL